MSTKDSDGSAESQLFYAIDTDDTVHLNRLLTSGLNPNTEYSGLDCLGRPLFWSALHLCCEKGREKCARILLLHGADVDAGDKRCQTPLMYAVQTEWHALVELLIDAGADVNVKERQGKSALHLAMECSDDKCLRMLLEAGAEVDVGDMYGRTPLWRASSEDGRLDKVQVLLEAGADPEVHDVQGRWTPLQAALKHAGQDRAEYIRLLVAAGASVNHRDRDNHNSVLNLIMKSSRLPKPDAYNDLTQLLELFLKSGYDVNHVPVRHKWHSYGGTALKFATDKNAPTDVVRILLEHGSDPDIPDHTGGTALLSAAYHGREDVTSLLLQYNCQLDNPGEVRIERICLTMTPLQCAIHIGFTCVARLLVLAGASLRDLTYLWTNQDVPEQLVMDCDFWSWLIEQATCVPPLLVLCQRTIRKLLGKPIQSKVEILPLPKSVREFVLLKNIL